MKKIIVVALALLVSGCTGANQITKEQIFGAAGGSLIGTFIGYKFGGGTGRILFALVGGAVGAVAGADFAKELTSSDRAKIEQTTIHAMHSARDGQLVTWNNDQTGAVGTVTPVRSYFAKQGVYCRDFEANVAIAVGIGEGRGRACRVDGGPWQIAGNA